MVSLIPAISNKIMPNILWRMHDEQVYITFDDGPDPDCTPKILNLLRALDIRATFFVLGHKAELYPEIVEQMNRDGHTLANHSYSHAKMLWKSREQIRFELKNTDEVLFKITGIKPTLFRPPFGQFGIQLLNVVKSTKHKIVLWSSSILDYKAKTSITDIQKNLLKCTGPGKILLMHDGHQHSHKTVKALEISLGTLKEQNIMFSALPN